MAFLATPAEVSLELAPKLLARGLQVVDLSGAFRLLDPAAYPTWYGFAHTAAPLLAEARYGLPELAREQLRGARLVTNPGCYATAIALGLAPLLRSGLCLAEGVTVTGLSGVSGAGRKASEEFSFCEVDEDLRAYRIGKHQHVPEIEQTVARYAGALRPHLLHPGAHPHPPRHPGLLRAAHRPRRHRRGALRGAGRRLRRRALREGAAGGQGAGQGRRPHQPLPRRRRGSTPGPGWRWRSRPSTTW